MKRLFIVLTLVFASGALAQSVKWPEEKANDWYARQPWPVGANYIPSTAVNQLEMWQNDTFDIDRINLEMIWAENLGMNTMRVFLHDLLWKQDQGGFRKRIDRFLSVAKKHHIRPIFVLFDSCWDPFPEQFHQRPPLPGVHNSRWLQSPGANALSDPKQEIRILEYVANVVLAFADDDRVLAWDVWNEPDNLNQSSYGRVERPDKEKLVLALLPKVFQYARSGRPSQPLTSGLWKGGDWSSLDKLSPIEKIQVEQSDIISFHNYEKAAEFEKRVEWLQHYNRPIFCTEYMARPRGSTFETILPIAKKYKVAAYNWGFVAGKSQTWLPWDSWEKPYVGDRQPAMWFHDIFKSNGVPYSQAEVDFIKQILAEPAPVKAKAAKK
jgi:hypothetical protein